MTFPNIMLQYGFTPDGKLAGDQIVTEIDDTLVEGTIDALGENETLMVVTPDNTFEALKEKYKDNPNIKFVNIENAQGDEADYTILNVKFGIVSDDNKFSTLQKIYTLLTRARKGTRLVKSVGLAKLNIDNAAESVAAAMDISFNPESDSAKEYIDTRLAALNLIPGEETSQNSEETSEENAEEKKPKTPEIVYKYPHEASTLEDQTQTLEQVTNETVTTLTEEAANATESELSRSATDASNEFNGDENLGIGLKGLKLKAFKD